MTNEEFMRVFTSRLQHCTRLVESKRQEYAQGNVDRFIQFIETAKMNKQTPAQALWGMWSKHTTSVNLAIRDIEPVTEKWLDDKISDMVLYAILAEGVLRDTQLVKEET